eukprot:CAMPEP_0197073120 /NCGR_PEP_ID=MMETSP1384-20130603/210443_1 /TAXON_ID=29189 /ORGANISM="Ammonia sp." /LENGTH=411 /DNA_ID=CAMNT_0042511949 /DNA_START=55 /DNA_END=1290 /DNA_ORIENTATION=-
MGWEDSNSTEALEFTSTVLDFVTTSLLFTSFDTEPSAKAPKQPKASKRLQSAQNNLEFKQSLAIISIIIISALIILALVQTKLTKDCLSSFRAIQWKQREGRTLFTLFIIALILSLTNCIVFVQFIFHIDQLDEDAYAWLLMFSMIPYRLIKLCTSLFFIFRLHFVFRTSALFIPLWTTVTLGMLAVATAVLGCVASIGGPLRLMKRGNPVKFSVTSLGITMLVDIVVMILYIQRLVEVTVMNGQITNATSTEDEDKTTTTQTAEVELQTTGGRGGFNEGEEEQSDGIQTGIEGKLKVKTKVTVDEKFVQTITKSTLLSLIGILTSFWLHIEMLVLISQDESDGVLLRAVGSFDGAVNVVCMYLVFGFASPYYRVGCKWCHFGMRKLCKKYSKQMVLRKASEKTGQRKCCC